MITSTQYESTLTTQKQEAKTIVSHKAYLVGLDSLRGIAALMVCLYHFTNGALPKAVMPTTKWLFAHGNLGVEIFFVLSGFIIPYSLIGKSHKLNGFFVYMKKRLIRINPPAYIATFLTIGQAFFIDKIIQHSNTYTKTMSGERIIHNLLFTIPFTHYKWIVGVLWTLAIEFQFYIFIGVLFVLLFERKQLGWFIGLYLSTSIAQHYIQAPDSFLEYNSLFALGGVALLWQQQRLAKWSYAALLLLFTGLAYWQLGMYVALAGLATTLALNALNMQLIGLKFLGKMSYSFYLLHLLIGTSCEFLLIKIIPPSSDVHKLFIIGLALIAAIVGSYAFYRVVEQPFIRLASRQR